MKKRLNAESVTNELRGGSAFFPNYEKTTPLPENWKTRKPVSQETRKLVDFISLMCFDSSM